jgi:hypothetical protein
MHPDTVGGDGVSADYPGVLARLLAEYKGTEMVTVFANGCCGNLNHRNIQWADGDQVAWVSLPGEIFVELGLEIKQGSPFRHTQIAELANGSIGYIPDEPAYAQGNYEVVSARCAKGSGEMLVEAALRLLKEMNPPEPQK